MQPDVNKLGEQVIGAAMRVHTALGPGLLESAYRLDIVVEGVIVLELKAVDKLLPIHSAQLISYLKLGNYPLGYLFNFNTVHLREGIKRLVNTGKKTSASSVSSL